MVLEGIEKEFNEEESKLNKIIKKVLITILALFLVVLVLSYLVPGTNLLSILEGRFVSSPLDNFTIILEGGGSVVFEKEVYEELRTIYLKEQKNEFKVCLLGNKTNDIYYIKELESPKTFSKDVFSVSAEQCRKETLIPLHGHPFKHCIFSEQDVESFKEFKKINKDSIMGLMCEKGRFGFYGY